jgi:uncharacterized protein YicC (UPF0701 family)
MSNGERRLTIAYIESRDCSWPFTVKEQAKLVLRLSAELTTKRRKLAELNMMEPEKIDLMEDVARLHQHLGVAYRNMARELKYSQALIDP